MKSITGRRAYLHTNVNEYGNGKKEIIRREIYLNILFVYFSF